MLIILELITLSVVHLPVLSNVEFVMSRVY
jgi:hypothetical protein